MASKRSRSGRTKTPGRRQGHPARRTGSRGDTLSDDAAEGFARRLRTLVATARDPLEAALMASQFCEPWCPPSPALANDLERDIGLPVVGHVARIAGDESLAALRALEHAGTDRLRASAGAAADRLADTGAAEPDWLEAARATALADTAIVHTDAFDDAHTLLFEFAAPDREPHTLGVHVDRMHGSIAQNLLAGPALLRLSETLVGRAGEAGYGRLRLTTVDPVDATVRALSAMHRTATAVDPPIGDALPALWSLARTRLRALPGADRAPVDVGTVSGDARRELARAFAATVPYGTGAEPTPETIARAVIDVAVDTAGGDPLRISPAVVRRYREHTAQDDAAVDDDERRRRRDALRSWAAFAGARSGLDTGAVAQTLAAVDAPLEGDPDESATPG